MRAAALVAGERGARHQDAHGQEVLHLPALGGIEHLVEAVAAPELEHPQDVRQVRAAALDADVAPHRAAQAGADVRQVELTVRGGLHLAHELAREHFRERIAHDRLRHAAAEDESLEQAVRRQAVGAMHAVGGHLAAGVQAGHAGAPVDIRVHAADHVVRRGRHGDAVARGVDVEARQHARQAREALHEAPRREVPAIEEDVAAAGAGQVPDDGLAHDVARRQLCHRMQALHEALAALVDEVRALAADGLADEHAAGAGHVERGGVELEELEVGELRARAPRHGQAVAGGDLRVGGLAVHLPRPAGRQHGGAGPDDLQAVARVPRERAGHAAGAVGGAQEVHGEATIEDAHAARGTGALDQAACQLVPRGVAVGMHDARVPVPTLEGERRRAVRRAVEPHAPLEELRDLARAFRDQRTHRGGVAQAGAGVQRVGHVAVHGVLAGEDRGDAALRPAGVREVHGFLGQDDHVPVPRGLDGRPQPRDARAHHQHIREDLRQQRAAERDQESTVVEGAHGVTANPLPAG